MKCRFKWFLSRVSSDTEEMQLLPHMFATFEDAVEHARGYGTTAPDGFLYVLEARAVIAYGGLIPAEG